MPGFLALYCSVQWASRPILYLSMPSRCWPAWIAKWGIVTGIACVVVLAASWWIARAIRAASQQSKALTLRDEKTATYQLFVEFWENLLRQKLARSDQFSDKLKVLERLLALYGGAGVVKAHTALRDKERDKGAQHADVRALLGEALAAIRSDLGVDTPRHIAGALEQLILPACDAEGGAAEIRDEPGRAVLAPNP